jgi:hypothetical protein
MSYETLDEYANAETRNDFQDAKVDALKALRENDLFKVAIAIGNMVAQFELTWEHKQILAKKLEQKSS